MSFSKIVKKVSVVGAFGMMGLLGSDSAQAAPVFNNGSTDSTTLVMSVDIAAACTIAGGGTVTFTAFNAAAVAGAGIAGDAATATTSLSVQCSTGVAWEVHPDLGQHDDGATRRMDSSASPGNYLTYDVYTSANVLVPFDLTGATSIAASGTGTGAIQAAVINFGIDGGQQPELGGYSDILAMQVWY